MKNLETLLNEYAESHRNPVNLKIHMICVPLIEWSLLGVLSLVPRPWPGPVTFAHLFAIAALLYYLQFRNWKAVLGSLGMVIAYLGIIEFLTRYSLSHQFELYVGVFVLAWIGQFIGHHIEGKKPSFFKDLFFLLIGPLWILEEYLQIFHFSIRER